MIDHLRHAQTMELMIGDVIFELDHGRLIDARLDGRLGIGLSLPPPAAGLADHPLSREAVDETLCIARYLDANSHRVRLLHCDGQWAHPMARLASFEPLKRVA
jgi:hypothetical protein